MDVSGFVKDGVAILLENIAKCVIVLGILICAFSFFDLDDGIHFNANSKPNIGFLVFGVGIFVSGVILHFRIAPIPKRFDKLELYKGDWIYSLVMDNNGTAIKYYAVMTMTPDVKYYKVSGFAWEFSKKPVRSAAVSHWSGEGGFLSNDTLAITFQVNIDPEFDKNRKENDGFIEIILEKNIKKLNGIIWDFHPHGSKGKFYAQRPVSKLPDEQFLEAYNLFERLNP